MVNVTKYESSFVEILKSPTQVCDSHRDCIGCSKTIDKGSKYLDNGNGRCYCVRCKKSMEDAITKEEENSYYMQNGFVGNSILWWKDGRSGYTANIDNAHVFTKEEALDQHKTRKEDIPWPKTYIDKKVTRHVDGQHLNRKEAEE